MTTVSVLASQWSIHSAPSVFDLTRRRRSICFVILLKKVLNHVEPRTVFRSGDPGTDGQPAACCMVAGNLACLLQSVTSHSLHVLCLRVTQGQYYTMFSTWFWSLCIPGMKDDHPLTLGGNP